MCHVQHNISTFPRDVALTSDESRTTMLLRIHQHATRIQSITGFLTTNFFQTVKVMIGRVRFRIVCVLCLVRWPAVSSVEVPLISS